MKVVLVAFADKKNIPALDRLRLQADALGCHTDYRLMVPTDLDAEFRAHFSEQLSRRVRGYGYFVWKPQVVLQAMNDVEEGDIVHYVDAGCHLNPRAAARFQEYVQLCARSELGVLGFMNEHRKYLQNTTRVIPPSLPMSSWTKGDLIDYFGVRSDDELLAREQICATTFLVQKRPSTARLVQNWLDVFRTDFSLCDDSQSRSRNLPGFVEHRHDQAVFSLLCHTSGGFASACISEIEWQRDWRVLDETPIHARRDLNYPWKRKVLANWIHLRGMLSRVLFWIKSPKLIQYKLRGAINNFK